MIIPASDFTFDAYLAGDYGDHCIIHGDCRDVLPKIPDKAIDLVLTDPPYGIGKAEWDNDKPGTIGDILAGWRRTLTDSGTLWFFHMVFSSLAEIHFRLVKAGFKHKQMIVLNKGIK